MPKKFFLVTGPTSSGNHVTARLLIGSGCFGSFRGIKPGEPQLELDAVVYRDEAPPEHDLLVMWRSIPYNGVYVDFGDIIEKFRKHGYLPHVILVMRDWTSEVASFLHRHKTYDLPTILDRIYQEYSWQISMAVKSPYMIFNTSMLFSYPEHSIARLEEFTGVKISEPAKAALFDADQKWNPVQRGWSLDMGDIDVWNLPKAYAEIPWNGSAGSKTIGALLPGLICSGDCKSVLEIGIANGFTTAALARGLAANGGGRLVSCDINEAACRIGASHTKHLPITHEVICADSILQNWRELFPDGIDLGYIDGDHSYEFCRADVQRVKDLITEGGYLILHDYNFGMPGVPKAAKELLGPDEWDRIVVRENSKSCDLQAGIFQRRFMRR